jgi:hypothetical protein
MLRIMVLLAPFCVVVAAPAIAGGLPDKLTFGYEYEGEVDASPKACEATVREVVEWSDEEVKRATADVCAARKAHVDAYAAIQQSYKEFAKTFGEDTRLNTGEAVEHFQQLVKECIDHKTGITTGGHNIALDIIPNQIASECLALGKRLLDEETAWYKAPPETHTRLSP